MLQTRALPVPYPHSRSPSFPDQHKSQRRLQFQGSFNLLTFLSVTSVHPADSQLENIPKPPRLQFLKIRILDGKPHVIVENRATVTKLRCLASKRPSRQPVNPLIFLSNDFSLILFITYPEPPTVSVNALFNHCSSHSAGRKSRSQSVNSLRVWFSWALPQAFFPHRFLSKTDFPIHVLDLNQSPPRPSFSNFEAFSPSISSSPLALSFQSANLCKSLPLGK